MNVYRITYRHADTGTEGDALFRAETLAGAVAACEAAIDRQVEARLLRPTVRSIVSAREI